MKGHNMYPNLMKIENMSGSFLNAYKTSERIIKGHFSNKLELGGVMNGSLLDEKGLEITSRKSGACHAWVGERINFAPSKVYYILTSLRKYTNYSSKESYKPYKFEDIANKWYNDICSLECYMPVIKESVFIKGPSESEDYLLTRYCPDNAGLVAPFMVLTRHPYEQSLDLRTTFKNPTNTFSFWYQLCFKGGFDFGKIYPFITTLGIGASDLVLYSTYHSHSSLDVILDTYPNISLTRKSWGYSQSNFKRRSINDIERIILGKGKEKEVKNTIIFGSFSKKIYQEMHNRISDIEKEENNKKTKNSIYYPFNFSEKGFEGLGEVLTDFYYKVYVDSIAGESK